jgi:hypothetical protein
MQPFRFCKFVHQRCIYFPSENNVLGFFRGRGGVFRGFCLLWCKIDKNFPIMNFICKGKHKYLLGIFIWFWSICEIIGHHSCIPYFFASFLWISGSCHICAGFLVWCVSGLFLHQLFSFMFSLSRRLFFFLLLLWFDDFEESFSCTILPVFL